MAFAVAMVTAMPAGVSADEQPHRRGSMWVFAVGVSQYHNPAIDLEYGDNDAVTLAAAFQQLGKGVFDGVKTDVLVNQQVTKQSILTQMPAFFAQASSDDTGIVALMGHGATESGTFYFVPYPADLSNLATEGLPVSDFANAVHQFSIRLAKTVIIVDTCHAAALNFRMRGLDVLAKPRPRARGVSLVGDLSPRMPNTYILSSSESDEDSWEDASYRLPGEQKGHGVFTYALLEGLDGGAAGKDGTIKVLDLFSYATDKVEEKTGSKQIPYMHAEGTNFPLARALSPPSADQARRAGALVRQGLQYQQAGQLDQAQTVLAKADATDPTNQVSRVLKDEVTDDLACRNDPQAQQDMVERTAQLLKGAHNSGHSDPWAPRPLAIAFLDFSTLGSSPELAGLHEALVARLSQDLQGTKRVVVVDRHLLDSVLKEMQLSMSDLSDPATRLKLQQTRIAHLFGTGNVVFLGKDQYVLNLQMIDTETTEIQINLSEQGNGAASLVAVAEKTAADVLKHVQQSYPLRGRIVALDGDQAVIDAGAEAGVTVGTRMNAIVEEPITVNGEVIAMKSTRIGSLEITEVQPKASFARVVDHSKPLGKGTKVVEVMKANQAPAKAASSSVATAARL